MKKFLLALLAIVTCIGAKGADVTGALTNVASPTITYQSVDANNNSITLSAKLYYKNNKNVDFVMINCHATITHNDGCPTGDAPQMEAVKYMVSENCLLICPDYIGFGNTKNTTHPYMCSTLTARNILDCYKAAIKYVKETGKRTINTNYYTINVGYSQGGATALAFQRYLETEATDEDRKLVNLRGSVCGAGPYSQNIVFDTYEDWCKKGKTLDYPIYLYYVLNGHKAAFGKTVMRNLELEECFTPKFWEYLQSGFKAKFEAKGTNVDELNNELKSKGFNTFYSIINSDYADHNSKVYRIIQKTLEQSNLLKKGWDPTAPIIFYHDKAGNDIVVPYACTEAARERFKDHCTYVDAIDDYGYDVIFRYGIATTDKENYLWHPAVFRKIWEDQWVYVGQNTIMGLAGITGNDSYDFDQLDHRTFGARFYAQFLAKRACLRPTSGAEGEGTAHNTNIDPATPLHQEFSATAPSTADTYDRVTTAMPYAIPAGKPVFVQFAAPVDGYYFGADAPRYEVTLNSDGEAETYRELADEEDFKADKVYLITSEKEETEPVVSMVAGLKVETAKSDLAWRTLNIRKLNVLNGTSYASAYMPFAYTTIGTTLAYGVTNSEDETKVKATSVKEVPYGTGVLLVDDNATTSALLQPITDHEAAQIETILTGTYSKTPNLDTYRLFGKSNKGNVGFYLFSSSPYVNPYSAYINLGSSDVKGYDLTLEDSEDAMEQIKQNKVAQSIYSIDGTSHSSLQHGLNIIRMSDGSVKKLIKK